MLYEIALLSFKNELTFRDACSMYGQDQATDALVKVAVFIVVYENNKEKPYYDIRAQFIDISNATIEDFEDIYNAFIEVYGDE